MQQSIQELAEKHVKSCYPMYEYPELLVDIFIAGYATAYVDSTPPSEADWQGGINVPIKIIETLIYYGHIHTVGGVQPVDMKSHKDTIWEAIEWLHQNCDIIDGERRLKSHPAPSGPVDKDYDNLYCAAHSALAKIKVRCLHFAQSGNPKLLEQIQELAINTLAEIISMKQPSPDPNPPFIVQSDAAPVEADFETALEAEVERQYKEYSVPDHRHGFKDGAKWARQYLSSIPETTGPWHLKSHANTEDDDTVWATDGKMSFYIDEFNFDDFPEADYWLVNFLNKYRFKLSIDESHQIVISHLEEQIAHLKSQQAGPKWVRASKRLPKNIYNDLDPRNNVHSIFTEKSGWVIKGAGNFFSDGEEFFCDLGNNRVVNQTDFDRLFWLSDSPAPEQVDPVGFAKFVIQDPSVILRGKIDFDRLLSKYTASLQTKQP